MSCKAKQMRDSSDVSLGCKLEAGHEGGHEDSKLGEWSGAHDPTCECPVCHAKHEKLKAEAKAAAEKAKGEALAGGETDAALHSRVEQAVDETLSEMEAKEAAKKAAAKSGR